MSGGSFNYLYAQDAGKIMSDTTEWSMGTTMSIENTVGSAHALLGASNSHRWMACRRYPIFVRELQRAGTIPLQTTNEYAAQGTVAHAVAEMWVNAQATPPQPGWSKIQDGFEIAVDTEMIEAVKVYVDYVLSAKNKGARVRTEQRLAIPEPEPRRANYVEVGPLWGTTDGEILTPYKYLEIVDYKHGAGKFVPVENNPQLKYYAAASYLALPLDVQREIPVIKTTIVQPRHYSAATTGGVWSVEYEPSQIVDFAQELIENAALVTPDATLSPGDHCEWCPAASHCPARLAHHSDKIGFMLAKADATEAAKTPPPLPIEALSEQQILAIVDNADLIRDYLDAAEAHVKSKIMAGGTVPGWAVKVGYGHRKWVDEAECGKQFKQVLGDDAYTIKLKTPAEMEKALKAAKITCPDFEEHVTRKVSSHALIRERDLKPQDEVFKIADMAKAADKIETSLKSEKSNNVKTK